MTENVFSTAELLKVWALTGLGILVAVLIVALASAAAIFVAKKYLQVAELNAQMVPLD